MIKHLMIITLFFSLSGCVAINKINDSILNSGTTYTEPTSGKLANVRVFYGYGKNIQIFPNSSTKSETKNDKDSGKAFTSVKTSGMLGFTKFDYAKKSLGMPNAPETNSNYGEFKVPAGRPILISMSYYNSDGSRAQYCSNQMFRVQFEENKNYALALNIGSGCYYVFEEYIGNTTVPLKAVQKL